MKAKTGQMIVDFWKIDMDQDIETYEPWLNEGIAAGRVRNPNSPQTKSGNISGLLLDKYMGDQKFVRPDIIKDLRPRGIAVTSTGPFPMRGFEGDYLIHSDQLVNKYEIVSAKTFAKDYQILDS